jgi:hypothetical protein
MAASSTQPFAAAAFTKPYSPETLYAATGTLASRATPAITSK